MRMFIGAAIIAAGTLGLPTYARCDINAWGAAWSHSETGTVSAHPEYSYNSAGGDITIENLSTGRYQVMFKGLGGIGGGNVLGSGDPAGAGTPEGRRAEQPAQLTCCHSSVDGPKIPHGVSVTG